METFFLLILTLNASTASDLLVQLLYQRDVLAVTMAGWVLAEATSYLRKINQRIILMGSLPSPSGTEGKRDAAAGAHVLSGGGRSCSSDRLRAEDAKRRHESIMDGRTGMPLISQGDGARPEMDVPR